MYRYDCLYDPNTPIRQLLIEAAELDVQRYFRPLGEIVVNGREVHASELDWLVLFRDPLQDINIAKFLAIYRLRCFLQFNRFQILSTTLQGWVRQAGYVSLQNRVMQLRETMFFPSNEYSAASKFSFFANPRSNIFIWDSHVRRAIDHRYPLHGEPRPNGYSFEELSQFSDNAVRCLSHERAQTDFDQALNVVVRLLNPVRDAVFERSEDSIRDFAARRLLDKLMHYEGRLLEKKLLRKFSDDPCGVAAQQTIQGWIEQLGADIRAADEANRRPDAAD